MASVKWTRVTAPLGTVFHRARSAKCLVLIREDIKDGPRRLPWYIKAFAIDGTWVEEAHASTLAKAQALAETKYL